jgi:hypothetical protein
MNNLSKVMFCVNGELKHKRMCEILGSHTGVDENSVVPGCR